MSHPGPALVGLSGGREEELCSGEGKRGKVVQSREGRRNRGKVIREGRIVAWREEGEWSKR